MNLGLGNLNELKGQLLAEALRVDTSYDAQITAIGRGAAAAINKHCNRQFERVENATFISPADRTHVILDRFPVESISQVELKTDETTGWEVQTADTIIALKEQSGIVHFGAALGPSWSELRITYTGGYWFDTTEENNDSLPDGAELLPADVKLAWYLHCKTIWQSIDKIGQDIVKTGSSATNNPASVAGLDMAPDVKAMLNQFVRYAIL